jgi:hypothetical protein
MTEKPNRRNVLTILGLAGAVTPALAIESVDTLNDAAAPRTVPGLMMRSPETQNRIADALEEMAKAVRSAELIAMELKVESTAKFDNWMEHEIRIKFELAYPPEA